MVDAEDDPLGASRQRGHEPASMHPGHGTRQHRAGADLVPRETAKRLSEAIEVLLEQLVDRLVGAIARRDPRSARRDDCVRQVLVAESVR